MFLEANGKESVAMGTLGNFGTILKIQKIQKKKHVFETIEPIVMQAPRVKLGSIRLC